MVTDYVYRFIDPGVRESDTTTVVENSVHESARKLSVYLVVKIKRV